MGENINLPKEIDSRIRSIVEISENETSRHEKKSKYHNIKEGPIYRDAEVEEKRKKRVGKGKVSEEGRNKGGEQKREKGVKMMEMNTQQQAANESVLLQAQLCTGSPI